LLQTPAAPGPVLPNRSACFGLSPAFFLESSRAPDLPRNLSLKDRQGTAFRGRDCRSPPPGQGFFFVLVCRKTKLVVFPHAFLPASSARHCPPRSRSPCPGLADPKRSIRALSTCAGPPVFILHGATCPVQQMIRATTENTTAAPCRQPRGK